MRRLGVLLLAVLLGSTASAFNTIKDSSDIYVVTWDPGTVSMQIKLPAPSEALIDGSTSYETSVRAAMQMWNAVIGVVNLQGQSQSPGAYANGNEINEIVMDSKVDGDDFSANTLAITSSFREGNLRTEADIVFNTAYVWDSYRGAYRSDRQDIRRVALHELGHVLGLQHPDEAKPAQSVGAIMNSRISNVETLLPDDISGMQSLYGEPRKVPANDNFYNARSLSVSDYRAVSYAHNIAATAEAGEPSHAGEPAKHSVWWSWKSVSADPAILTTMGSDFDTTLAVYTGSSVGALKLVASNDDEDRGVIRSSRLTLNPTVGETYYVAVDGWGGYFGQIQLTLFEGAAPPIAPKITQQPISQSVADGGMVEFTVEVTGTHLNYQWYFNGNRLSEDWDSSFLVVRDASPADAGNYSVVVSNASGTETSRTVTLSVLARGIEQQAVTVGHDVTMVAPALSGDYLWLFSTNNGSSWTSLTDSTTYAGTRTSTLVISAVTMEMGGYRYRYSIKNVGGSSYGGPITLSVSAPLLPFPVAIAVDASGNLYVGDQSTQAIHKISTTNQVSVLAGSSGQTGSADGTGSAARFNQPGGLTTAAGVLTVADTANGLIRRVTTTGAVTTLAGTVGVRGNTDGAGATATFGLPMGIGQGSVGTFTIADATNHTIRQLNASGSVSTLAGSAGSPGSADGNSASARFNYPTGIAVDSSGTIYVADTTNNLIRKIAINGTVTTLAGVVGVSGWQDGIGGGALFNQPGGLAVDGTGNLYVADAGNSAIRKITPNGSVTTLAGLSTIGGLKDGTGSDAWFNQPRAVAVDAGGNVFVADTGNAAIRKITPAGEVTTFALTEGPANSGGGSSSGGGGTTTPPPASSGGGSAGGGGGGGAPSVWFLGAMSLVLLVGWQRRRAA